MQTNTTINQEQLTAIHNCLSYAAEQLRQNNTGSLADVALSNDLALAHKVTARIAHSLYEEWQALPDGSALKDLYQEDVWHPQP